MKSLVSIIVPAYNEEKYINKCLQSIKNQSYSPIELIVVDDGSSDRTAKLANKYTDLVFSQKHLGAGEARNLGAVRAKGKVLVFVDADMFLDKNYILNITKPIFLEKAEATFTLDEYVANENNIWAKCFNIDNNLDTQRRIPENYPERDSKFRAITKELFQEKGGYLTTFGYGEDTVLKTKEAILAKGAICYHNNPDNLKEVYFSARWMGRSKNLQRNLKNILRYSIFNSLRISMLKIINRAPLRFAIYKIVFDFGMLNGILIKSHHEK